VAECLHVAVRMENGARLEDARKFPPLSDSVTLQECFTEMWAGLAREIGRQRVKKTSVTLTGLSPVASHTQLELFAGGPSAEALEKRARLSRVLDGLIGKFGRDAVTIGISPGEGAGSAGPKIAFNRIPGREDFEEK
jgi:DNA polymerase-4